MVDARISLLMIDQVIRRIFALLLASAAISSAAPLEASPQDRTTNPAGKISGSRQLLVSVSGDWSATQAVLFAFSRENSTSSWQLNFSCPAVLGSKGMGWGLGLHGWTLDSGPVKHEGDKRSPAGLFYLPLAFGYLSSAEAKIVNYPYLHLTDSSFGVDDPLSPLYNRIVDRNKVKPGLWRSAEVMLRPDGAYRWGVVVSHNDPELKLLSDPALPEPGSEALGSCIFIHVWKSNSNPTIGCTALAGDEMELLIRWLRKDSTPLLLQLPLPEYSRLQKAWGLPELPNAEKARAPMTFNTP